MTIKLRLYANARIGNGPMRPGQTAADRAPLNDAPCDDAPTAATGEALAPTPLESAALAEECGFESTQTAIAREIAMIISAAPEYGQSLQHAFDAKEAQLRALFDRLAPAQRTALHASLTAVENAGGLSGLSAERRARLVSYLERTSNR